MNHLAYITPKALFSITLLTIFGILLSFKAFSKPGDVHKILGICKPTRSLDGGFQVVLKQDQDDKYLVSVAAISILGSEYVFQDESASRLNPCEFEIKDKFHLKINNEGINDTLDLKIPNVPFFPEIDRDVTCTVVKSLKRQCAGAN